MKPILTNRLLIAVFTAALATAPFAASGAFAAAKTASAHQKADKAGKAKSSKVKAATPMLDESYFLKASGDLINRGDRNGAEQLLQSAIIYAPDDPVPYQRLAQLYAKEGRQELAQQYYGIALDVQPVYAPALEGLAMLDLASGNRAGAQAQHDILLHACGAKCPETAQVEKALSGGKNGVDSREAGD